MSISDTPVTAPLAPPAQWHDHDSHGHVVQFYTGDAALLGAISRFIGTALGAGDAAVVIATRAHRDGLFQQLKERGFDVSGAVRQGRLIAVDAAETLSRFMLDGWPDPERFASVVGSFFHQLRAVTGTGQPRVAALGEMVALLWAEGHSEAAIRLEELWNDLARTHSFALHCAYPITNFNRDEDGDAFLRICATHSAVIPDESYTALSTDEERLRSISYLQQKVQALETAKTERSRAQNSLRSKQSELA
ncbi:MAG TPA: MEDS domain-containing protein, partial [Bryobacteraceae bacterium]|nr:MEDS domain-containing protein [Bryobacteraceae bacterium]